MAYQNIRVIIVRCQRNNISYLVFRLQVYHVKISRQHPIYHASFRLYRKHVVARANVLELKYHFRLVELKQLVVFDEFLNRRTTFAFFYIKISL